MASLIDMDNSVFGEQTPGGGLVWEYDAKNRRELEVAIFHLRTHSGLSVTPESMPPSGIETKLSTIFDIASSGGIGLPKFHNRSAVRGMSIGFSQCKIGLTVKIPWAGRTVAQFPANRDSVTRRPAVYQAQVSKGI